MWSTVCEHGYPDGRSSAQGHLKEAILTVVDDVLKLCELAQGSGSSVTERTDYGEVVLRANPAGLRTRARQLLTMAESEVPDGAIVHHGPGQELEDDALPLIRNPGF
jgi:hypothetical protein